LKSPTRKVDFSLLYHRSSSASCRYPASDPCNQRERPNSASNVAGTTSW